MSATNYKDLKQNEPLVRFFENFKECKNYENHIKKLKQLSEYRIRDVIKLGRFEIPDVGPDPKIENFYKNLKEWDDKDISDIKFFIKIYNGGGIESMEEAILLIHILKKNNPEKTEVLDQIFDDLSKNNLENIDNYIKLLNLEVISDDSVFFNSLFMYLVSLLNE